MKIMVQLVFQLNYFSKCYEKALSFAKLPDKVSNEAKKVLEKIEEFRKMIEKNYVASI